MGIVNVTPDSFSGDGILAPGASDPAATALALASRMVAEGADILDVGGESSRPGHAAVDAVEEIARVVPVIAAIRAAHPDVPISIDTTKPAVAAAALDVGADLVNDVWGVADDDAVSRLAGVRGAPIVLMHNRAEARYRSVVAEVVADLERAIERAVRAGVAWESIVVDPGSGSARRRSTTWSSCEGSTRCGCSAARSCWAPRASPRSARSWTCQPTSAWRPPSRPPRSACAPASTSSGSTTSARTCARHAWPTRSRGDGTRRPTRTRAAAGSSTHEEPR